MAVKRYDGSQWVTVAGKGDQGTSSSIATWVKTVSGGETSVSGNDDNSQPLSYTVGQELVFINGTLLKRGVDYVATTGNSITDLTALAANDVVTVWTVNAFSVTNAISSGLVTTTGDMIYASGANTPARLAIGSTGNVLTVSGGVPAWAAPASSQSNFSLVNAGGTALTGAQTITVSGISGADKILILVEGASSANAGSYIQIRVNADGGNNYYSYYAQLRTPSTYAATTTNRGNGGVDSAITLGRLSGSASSVLYGGALLEGCNTAGVKAFNYAGHGDAASNSDQEGAVGFGYYNSASAITSVSIRSTTGNLDAGTVYVYTSA